MDIFDKLKKEHDEVRDMVEKIKETSDRAIKTREKEFEKLYIEIKAHHEAEEEVVVPVLKDKTDTKEDGMEMVEEHHVIEDLLSQLDEMEKNDENWIIKFGVMSEILEHHLDEEENDVKKDARACFDKSVLKDLVSKFEDSKQKQKQKAKKEIAA